MENLLLNHYAHLFDTLSLEIKLELLSKLTQSIKEEVALPVPSVQKETLVDQLFGAWSDIDDDITDLIYESRTLSDRTFQFDEKK